MEADVARASFDEVTRLRATMGTTQQGAARAAAAAHAAEQKAHEAEAKAVAVVSEAQQARADKQQALQSARAAEEAAAATNSSAAAQQAQTAWGAFEQTSAKAQEQHASALAALAVSQSARQAAEQQAQAKQEVDEALRNRQWLLKKLGPRIVPTSLWDFDLRDDHLWKKIWAAHRLISEAEDFFHIMQHL